MPPLLAVLLAVAPAAGPSEYRAILDDYRAGRFAVAVDRLRFVPSAAVEAERKRVAAAPRCPACPADGFPFAAAVLAHTERAFLDREGSGHREPGAFHLAAARAWLEAGGSAVAPLAARWHLLRVLDALWWGDIVAEERAFAEGVRVDPSEARLWLAAGAGSETEALLSPDRPFVPVVLSANPLDRRNRLGQPTARRAALLTAEERYRRALELDAALLEARVRHARVLTHLGREKEALGELDRLGDVAGRPWIGYLAALFRGRLEEGRGDWKAAATAYRKATATAPGAETGWTALAHALDRAGDREGAESALDRVLAASEPDPYRGYPFGPHRLLQDVLEEMRGAR